MSNEFLPGTEHAMFRVRTGANRYLFGDNPAHSDGNLFHSESVARRVATKKLGPKGWSIEPIVCVIAEPETGSLALRDDRTPTEPPAGTPRDGEAN